MFVGVSHTFANNFVLGLELIGGFSGISTKFEDPAQNLVAKFKKKNSIGATAKAGYAVDSVTPYVKVGVDNAEFEGNQTVSTPAGFFNNTKTKKRLTGLVLGAGADFKVTEEVTVGAEFLHKRYGQMTAKVTNATNSVIGTKIKPTTNEFKIRGAYHFPV